MSDPSNMRLRQRFLAWILLVGCIEAGAPLQAGAKEGPRGVAGVATEQRTFAEWKAACLRLPSNRSLRGNMVPTESLPLKTYGELGERVTAFFDQCRTGRMGDTNLWVGELPTRSGFYNTETAYFLHPTAPTTGLIQSFIKDTHKSSAPPTVGFQPFAVKVEVPAGSEIYLHADLHGDLRSLLTDLTWLNEKGYLEGFRIVRPGFHMVFFGDYTDRGQFGIEVLYTLLRLKLENPEQVFLARGNHEEVSIASRYGFLSEGRLKYEAAFDAKQVLRAYDFLPVVIYLGTGGNYVQLHHGGMEPGYDPRGLLDAPGSMRFQFLGTLKQRQFLTAHSDWLPTADTASRSLFARAAQDFRPADPINPTVLGFMWNDFTLMAEEPGFAIDPGRAFVYGQRATQYLLAQTRTASSAVQAVFRGHQQSSILNPMMRRLLAGRGAFRHWQTGDSMALLGANTRQLEAVIERSEVRPVPAGSVWTLNISPDSVYGQASGYTYDTFGLLTTAAKFDDWRLRVVNVEVAF